MRLRPCPSSSSAALNLSSLSQGAVGVGREAERPEGRLERPSEPLRKGLERKAKMFLFKFVGAGKDVKQKNAVTQPALP